MKQKKIKHLINDYLKGPLSAGNKAEIRRKLHQQGFDLKRLEEYDHILSDLDLISIPEPSKDMDREFLSMLEDCKTDLRREKLAEKNRGRRESTGYRTSLVPRLAFGLLLLVIGWVIGYWFTPDVKYKNQVRMLSSEVKDMKKVMMLAMLDQPSASTRMKAVSATYEFEKVDDRIVSALLETLNNDPNVNVRLVTVETLANFSYNAKVRAGLIHSIPRQDSPIVQLALADVMLRLHEKRSVKYFQELLKKKDLDFMVKQRLEQTLKKLI